MNYPEKQLKYSIRKVSVGAASVVIGALYLLMGAGIAHADGMESAREANRTSNPADADQSGTGEPENTADLSNTDAVASTYNAPVAENPLVAPGSAKPRGKRALPDGETGGTSNGATGTESGNNQPTGDITLTRSRRTRRDVGNASTDGTTEGTSSESTGQNEDPTAPNADLGRKGSIATPDQPGVIVPKKNEDGGDDPNANLKFDKIKEDATTEELWSIIKKMPDDFQNNERSYLRNMNTLGDALRFKEGKVSTDGTGDKLQDGEIRELDSFGGWTAIAGEDGTPGKFIIGKKNAEGYFTGWYFNEKGERVQGGMLGGDALDNIFVHEQALDRRFKYMLMLVKGRTRANRNETVADKSNYDPRAENARVGLDSTTFNKLPFLERDNTKKYSPGVVGYNGIEKTFTAFSSQFGSRVRVEFVTGYISDYNGSKGSYRVVVKAKKEDGTETTVYDQTINRVAEIVQNEELYKKGLDVEAAHKSILKFLKDEFTYRVNQITEEKKKANPSLRKKRRGEYTEADKALIAQYEAEATEEAKKQGDIVMNVDGDVMSVDNSSKKDSDWKKTFTNKSYTPVRLANNLNNLLKAAIPPGDPDSPTWGSSSEATAQADDRAYKLLTALIPGAKKITYHVNDDQLEVETDRYSYRAARNGSPEVGIQGSEVRATGTADEYNYDRNKFDSVNTNTKVNDLNKGWARSGDEYAAFGHFVGVDKKIERDKVLTDEELTKKIKEKLGEGDSKLGKGGYFSSGDILLDKDVVSYTVQVFSADNNRVGVNTQSHRLQYNLPILADFSVIQNTLKPAVEVAKKNYSKIKYSGRSKKENNGRS